MIHLFAITLFAGLVAVVFGGISNQEPRAQVRYGLSVFAKFLLFALVVSWILYFVPR